MLIRLDRAEQPAEPEEPEEADPGDEPQAPAGEQLSPELIGELLPQSDRAAGACHERRLDDRTGQRVRERDQPEPEQCPELVATGAHGEDELADDDRGDDDPEDDEADPADVVPDAGAPLLQRGGDRRERASRETWASTRMNVRSRSDMGVRGRGPAVNRYRGTSWSPAGPSGRLTSGECQSRHLTDIEMMSY